MSKKRREVCTCDYMGKVNLGYGLGADSCCNFSCLVILILIILQFAKKKHSGKCKQVDSGILFIIALFFLACCNPCKK